MSVKPLTEHHLEFLSLKGGCAGSSESTLVECNIVGNLMSRLKCSLYGITGTRVVKRMCGDFSILKYMSRDM